MRNVVLVCLDTVRADYFAEYAPRLQAEADVVYGECRAASSWSAPSHASMFTGRLPHRHGIHAYNRDFSGLDRADTFLGELPEHRALGVSANVWAGSSFGFDGLFDEFSDVSPDRRIPRGIDVARFGQNCEREGIGKGVAFLRAALAHDHPLASLANGALVGIDDALARAPIPKPLDDGAGTLVRQALGQVERTSEPFVQFANVMDAHGPLHHVRGYDRSYHDAPYGWTSGTVDWGRAVSEGDGDLLGRYRGLYAAAIDYLDRKTLSFFEAVQARTDRETTFVVTSDHGDNLATPADEGLWGHTASSLTEGLLHVPCVVLNAPGPDGGTSDAGEDRGSDGADDRTSDATDDRTPEAYFSHLRLGDLTVGLAGGEVPDVREERIAAERIGNSGKVHTLAEKDEEENRMIRCVYGGDRKRCWDSTGGRASYRLDPGRPSWQEEVEEPVDVEALEATLFDVDLETYHGRAMGGGVEGTSMDDATEQRLRDLGYL